MRAQAETNTQLSGSGLHIARSVWVILVILVLGFWLVGTITLILEPLPDCIQVPCDPIDLNAGDLEVAEELNLPTGFLGGTFSYLAAIIMGISYFAIAGLIFWRKSDDWMGLLLSFMLMYLGGVFFTSSNDAVQRAFPETELLLEVVSLIGTLSIFALFFAFPDGRFVPRRLKWLALVLFVDTMLSRSMISRC